MMKASNCNSYGLVSVKPFIVAYWTLTLMRTGDVKKDNENIILMVMFSEFVVWLFGKCFLRLQRIMLFGPL